VNGIDSDKSKSKLVMKYKDYETMARHLVLSIRRAEDKAGDDEEDGVRRSDIVNQYLKDIADQIETEEELAEKKILVDKVLDRLITHDHVVLALSKEEDPFLVVHPNFNL